MPPKAIPPELEEDFIKAYLSKTMTTIQLAEMFGCSQSSVFNTLNRLGVELRGQPPRTDRPERRTIQLADEPIIIERYAKGESPKSIGDSYGYTRGAVYYALLRNNVEMREIIGENHPCWKGGRIVVTGGYVKVRVREGDPFFCMTDDSGYVHEHRLEMARSINRPLLPKETVHHIDGDRQNNDISNLQLRQGRHGSGVVMTCLDCGSCNIQSVPIADPE